MTIFQLEQKIIKTAQAYYEGKPLISDKEFDDLVEYLRGADPTNALLTTVGWGYDPHKMIGEKESHIYTKIIGIDKKPRSIEEMPKDYVDNLMIAAKLDGLSIVCYFNKGKLIKALTRGNGDVGINRTDKIKIILEKEIYENDVAFDFTGAIRGEICISNSNWQKMQEEGIAGESQRNTAAGIINRDEIKDDIKYVDIVFYKVVGYQDVDTHFNNILKERIEMDDCFDIMFLNKFIKNKYLASTKYIAKNDNINYAKITQDMLEALYKKFNIDYPCDGHVISKPTKTLEKNGNSIGIVAHEIAYKFDGETKNVKVLDITWELSKGQLAKPVVNVEPTELSGATIKNLSGYNAQWIKDNNITIGSTIEIIRSGEVIPKIMKLISPSDVNVDDYLNSLVCPACKQNTLEWSGVELHCTNKDCGNKDYQSLRVWVNNIAQVDGISETLVFKFFEELNINSLEDLYSKSFNELEYKDVEETSHKGRFNKVLDKLFKQPINLKNLLMALNIKMLGNRNGEKLSSNLVFVGSLKEMIQNNFEDTSLYPIALVKDLVGNVFSETLFNDVNIENWRKVRFVKGREIINNIKDDTEDLIPVVITGSLSVPRKQFEQYLKDNGYEVKSAINKDVKYLITDDPTGNSSKNKKANELGIEKITEQDIRDMIERS